MPTDISDASHSGAAPLHIRPHGLSLRDVAELAAAHAGFVPDLLGQAVRAQLLGSSFGAAEVAGGLRTLQEQLPKLMTDMIGRGVSRPDALPVDLSLGNRIEICGVIVGRTIHEHGLERLRASLVGAFFSGSSLLRAFMATSTANDRTH